MTEPGNTAQERWRLPDLLLPEGDRRQWYAVDGIITAADPGDTKALPGRFVMPGLVDAHVHLFIRDQQPLSTDDAIDTLRALARQGVLVVRDMGAPESLSLDIPADPGLPDVVASGRQLAVDGAFFAGCYDPVEPEGLVEAALAEVAKGATWVKVLTDWSTSDLTYPLGTLREMVRAVHAAGARVAAHCGWPSVRDVALTGVDSIEHGPWLDEETLATMADRVIAWVPTAGALEQFLRVTEAFLQDPPPDVTRERLQRAREVVYPRQLQTAANIERLLRLAVRLAVPVLVSTDNAGTVAEEVERFARYGVEPRDALRAATTVPRAFLGLPAIDEGAPADVVTYDRDPRADLSVLHRPASVVLKGQRIH
jgi:imidazolonepropionase-like amidohydrolase